MTKAQHIFIVGESPLVEEYATLCLSKRMTVSVRLNPDEKARLPKGVKKTGTPPKSATIVLELTNTSHEIKKKNIALLDRSIAPGIPIISSSITVTVAEQSSWMKRPERLIGIGALPSLLNASLIEFASSPVTSDRTVTHAKGFASSLGKETAIVQDSIGLVMPRILCMLSNEAYFAMMDGVAAGGDIDTAMKLGTNYPAGPVERAETIGIRHVYAVLSALNRHFGEERYRIAPLLRQAVFMGV